MALIVFIAASLALAASQPPEGLDQPTTTLQHAHSDYWLSMSDKVRPGNPFKVSANILKGSSPVEVQITFMNAKGEKEILTPAPVEIMPGGVKTFSIDIPMNISKPYDAISNYWEPRRYQVLVKGTGDEVSFNHTVSMSYEEKSFSTFIQTDKGMYKSGQKVMFRVLTVFPDMKAVRDEPYDIFITDPKDNRIRQWLGIKDPNGRGVIELWLQLASEVLTGDWTIHVKIMDREETKTFTVDDYVLPRFEVEVIAPPFALIYDQMLTFVVKATYTFGQPLTSGVAHLTIEDSWRGRPMRKKGMITEDGTVSVEIPVEDIRQFIQGTRTWLQTLEYQKITVTASVTETLTGREESSQPVELEFYKSPLRLKFLNEMSPPRFKRGLPYTIYAEVRKQDGSLYPEAEAARMTVYFNVTYDVIVIPPEEPEQPNQPEDLGLELAGPLIAPTVWNGNRYRKTVMMQLSEAQRIQSVPANGWLTLTFEAPWDTEASSVSVEAWSFDTGSVEKEVRIRRSLSKANSPSQSFMQLKLGTEKPKVGQTFQVTAEATDKMTALTYQVYSKGILLVAEEVQSPTADGANQLDFEFLVTRDMAPSFSLVAFYVREQNQEVVVDGLSLSADGLFANPVTVDFSVEKAEPGDKVDVIVKAKEDSTVYLLSADKSTILLKGGNDITQEDVTEDMAEYTTGSSNFEPWRYMFLCGWPLPILGLDARSVFKSANVIFLSDAVTYHTSEVGDYHGFPEIMLPELDNDMVAASGGQDSNRLDVPTPAEVVRKYFPEVWLWEISYITPDSGGQVVIPTTVPDTLTSWITTGFSMHPETGLSIVEKPTVLEVSRELFITLDLPSSLIRGEQICFTATLFSYHKGILPVIITLERSSMFNVVHASLEGNNIKLKQESVNYSYLIARVEENDIRAMKYCITPHVIGEIPIRVNATTKKPGLSDALERILVSKPEGVARATAVSAIADLPENGEWNQVTKVNYPEGTVDGSQRIEFSVSGNVFGSMFTNIDELLKKPSGCGEQNMLNFAPNIFLLQFYVNTKTLTDEIKSRALVYMNDGYQRENKYQHKDGGYSAFGDKGSTPEKPKIASTWLTAFVVKCYALAQQLYMQDNTMFELDTNVIRKALLFLDKTQSGKDGSFIERGVVFHKEMQGASASGGVSLTAYTLVALHEAREVFKAGEDSTSKVDEQLVDSMIRKAVAYLENSLPNLEDPFDICLTTYALYLVDASKKEIAFTLMETAMQTDGQFHYWARTEPVEKPAYQWTSEADAISIEMTAYALMVYAMQPDALQKGLPIVRWLIKNKGSGPGFISTQDTVIGLQALSSFGVLMYTGEDVPVIVTLNYRNIAGIIKSENFTLDKSNEMLLQKAYYSASSMPMPSVLEIIAKTPSGERAPSTTLIETTFHYNVIGEVLSDKFILEKTTVENENGFSIKVYVAAPAGESKSMSLIELEIPPGFTPDTDSLKLVKEIDIVEVIDQGTTLVIYFDSDKITADGVRFEVHFFNSPNNILTSAKPRSFKVREYYEPKNELKETYQISSLTESNYCTPERMKDVGVCMIVQQSSRFGGRG